MRTIYKIARLELANLFYSPVAWFLLVFLVFMVGNLFTGAIENMTQYKELRGAGSYAISESLFYNINGSAWRMVKTMLYFIMPLLTMGLISQEFNRGTIKLLFSAPITSRQIIIGKYFGILFYGLFMVAILMIYVVIAWIYVENFEWTAVLSGLLGLFLLFGFYAAIGLFMSTLTNYQIVAAIGMFAVIGFLQIISSIGQEYAFVRDLTYWMAIGNRVETFIRGMICSEDLLYFIILICMFLGFSILKIQLKRERCSLMGKLGRYMVVFLVAVLCGYVTTLPKLKCYYDATYGKQNTLSKESQEIVSKLDGGLKITTYVNMMDANYAITHERINDDISRYERYIRFKPEMKLDYVFYYQVDTTSSSFKHRFGNKSLKDVLNEEAKLKGTRLSRYLTPEEIDEVIDLSDENYRFISLVERENGRKTFLRSFNDSRRVASDTEISAAFKRIAMDLPRIGFISDHNSRSISGDMNRDYSNMISQKNNRTALINQGFDFDIISLVRDEAKLDSLDALFIVEPTEDFTSQELDLIRNYIDSGKNLVIATKPRTSVYLKPVMDMLGLMFEEGSLVQKPVKEQPANLILCRVTSESGEIAPTFKRLSQYGIITMPGATGIEIIEDRGFEIVPVLVSQDTLAWNELQTIDFINETASFDPGTGEKSGTKTTMLAMNREHNGHQQRMLVIGDADCFSMGELSAQRRGISASNGSLINGMFQWLSYNELPIVNNYPRKIDNNITMSMNVASVMTIVLKWIFPALILLLCGLLLIRRKGK